MNRKLKQFCEEISKEIGIDYNVVEEVVKSQFCHVKYIMERGRLENVMLNNLGKFAVKKGMLKRVEKLNKEGKNIHPRRKVD